MKKLFLIIGLIITLISGSCARTITGLITDEGGNPLQGVSIVLKGGSNGVLSDVHGGFRIDVPEGNVTLLLSFPGYEPQEVNIRGLNRVNIILEADSENQEGLTQPLKKPIVSKEVPVSEAEDLTFKSEADIQGRVAGVQTKRYDRVNSSHAFDKRSNANYMPVPEFNTEGYSAIHENGFKSPLREPLSTFSIDVDAASYTNVRRFINEGQKPISDAVRIEEMINYFDYDYPQPDDGHPFSINFEQGVCPWNRDNLLLHIGLQGLKMSYNETPSSNLVFLLDVSGSMNAPNKLPLVIKSMKLLVSQLRSQDRVAIVVYAGSSGLVLPSTPGNNKETIIAALERLQAGGSTAGSAGLKLAYQVADENFIRNGNNRIILATDGDFNVGPSSNAEMERMIESYRNKGIFISVAGFGMGNYKDDKMEIIADKGNGNYAYIDNLMEAKKVFINEFTSTLFTIAKDVKIQIEFNPVYVKEYRLVGYENRLLNDEDFENDKKDAGELGAGHTVTALYEIIPARNNYDNTHRLKYQHSTVTDDASENNELATIKFRYKKPDGDKSVLMTETIPYISEPDGHSSDNFRFSAAVAGFGMLLRESEFKGSITYGHVLSLARGSKGTDKDGYRAEFIRLVELSESGLTSMKNEE